MRQSISLKPSTNANPSFVIYTDAIPPEHHLLAPHAPTATSLTGSHHTHATQYSTHQQVTCHNVSGSNLRAADFTGCLMSGVILRGVCPHIPYVLVLCIKYLALRRLGAKAPCFRARSCQDAKLMVPHSTTLPLVYQVDTSNPNATFCQLFQTTFYQPFFKI